MPVSVDSVNNVFLGQWDEVTFIEDPLGPGYDEVYLGAIRDGSLEVATENFEYYGTSYPRRLEAVFPQQVTMTFSGGMEELHKRNMHIALGNLPSETSRYIYPGASCVQENNFGSLEAKRRKCSDLGGGFITAFLWKTTGSGAITLGSADEVVNMPVEFNASDDSNGDFGGSTAQPLGWIYAEDPAT